MRTYRYHLVDVFTDRPFGGNPLAVFPEAGGLDTDEMQAIAREMNLSETVFCLPAKAGAVRHLRIFTVDRELPLAGHPVVGTSYVLATTGVIPLDVGDNEVILELGAGRLPVRIEYRREKVQSVFMTQNPPRFGEPFVERDLVAFALGLENDALDVGELHPRVVDTGIPWFLIPLRDMRALRTLKPHMDVCEELGAVVGTDLFHAFTQDTGDPACAVRTRHVWFGRATPGEDPVTGSAIGCIGSYLVREKVILAAPVAEFSIEQGEEVGRRGTVMVRIECRGGDVTGVQVGGQCVHVGDGELWF